MKKAFVMFGAWLALAAGPAWANGINLGWLDCVGEGGGLANRAFACNTNAGEHVLVGSFVAPSGLIRVTGFEAIIDVQTAGPTLSPWWDIGGCRPSSVAEFSADFTAGPVNCVDYFMGGAYGGGFYIPFEGGPNRAQMRIGFALPLGSPGIGAIAMGDEAYAFKAVIRNSGTTGPGACSGCLIPACIVFNRLLVTNEPCIAVDYVLTNPAHRNHVTWQGGDPIACLQLTPALNTSWGAIKSLYR